MAGAGRRHRVCMVSDFFYPGFGGVEIHQYSVAVCLVKRGHKVVIVTRSYDDRKGVRWITGGIKVYYLPFKSVRLPPGVVTLPTLVGLLPMLRQILIREGITILHGHQTTSNMCHEAIQHATTMGIPTCFTDHSLFGFADGASIHINKVLEFSLLSVGHVICVSHTSKENTVLRAKIPPNKVSIIPNATDTSIFVPREDMKGKMWEDEPYGSDEVTIVVVTRLVYRKGADLLVDVVPEICRRHPKIRWVIGGDGPRMLQVKQMVERHNLYRRVELLGAVKHEDVPGVLRRGQLFLNTSLTEAFCIAIIEAVSTGLLAVSTRVGGVPEILPPDMLLLADPDPQSILDALEQALLQVGRVSPWRFHDRVCQMYNWDDVAGRTEVVYDKVVSEEVLSLYQRVVRAWRLGQVFGVICVGVIVASHLLWRLMEWWQPQESIEHALDYPSNLAKAMVSRKKTKRRRGAPSHSAQNTE